MANIFQIINYLYTKKDSEWIQKLNEEEIQPYVIQRWLAMNDMVRVQTRWLDKYVFVLSPKMYLSLAWSILPKSQKAPYAKYIKKQEEDEEFDFVLQKIRKQFEMGDNDYRVNKERILKEMKKDLGSWFAYYGVPKKYWKKYCLDFNKIKCFGVKPKIEPKGLDAWGM